MSLAAKFALVAGLSRIDGDGIAGNERLAIPSDRALPHGLDDSGEFVAQYQRALQDRRTDPAILVGVKIAAANSHGFHANDGLPGRGGCGAGELFQPKVGRAVESNAAHWSILPEVRVAVTRCCPLGHRSSRKTHAALKPNERCQRTEVLAMIHLKRAYEAPSLTDGERILVERLWPRGLTKARAAVDLWLKDLAPSPDLRKWFGHDPARWKQFKQRYWKELNSKPEAVELLASKARRGIVTFVYAARDREHNGALALKEFLEQRKT
jgi:uncharacterized protein YeaO (DUF488 family)